MVYCATLPRQRTLWERATGVLMCFAFGLLLAFDAHLKRRGAVSLSETATSQLAQ